MKKRQFFFIVMVLLIFQSSFGQLINISGTVTSSNDALPLPGVNIAVKGSSIGTVTDFDGNYQITINKESTLIYSFIGYTTTEIQVGSEKEINVKLKEGGQLDEIVVTALGIKKEKKALSYAIQELKSEELLEGNQNNLVNGLQGKISGVTVVGSGGAPGESAVILIRGGTSITGNNQPLFVVDGVPIDNSTDSSLETASTNRASDINPEDIESISVLKGAAAAALYGIKASEGAIIITTKRGKNGVTTINYSGSLSVNSILGTPNVQKAYGQGEQLSGGGYNEDSQLSWGDVISSGTDTYDNIADFYQTAITNRNNLSYSSGTEKSSIYFSIGDVSQKGVIESTSYDKTSFKINSITDIAKNLTVQLTGNYIDTKISSTKQGSTSGGSMLSLLSLPANVNGKDYLNDDGSQKSFFTGQEFDNPYWSIDNSPNTNDLNRFIGVIGVNYVAFNDFNLSYKLGLDTYNQVSKRIIGDGSLIDGYADGYISQYNRSSKIFTSNLMLSYNKQLSDDFTLDVLIGNSIEERDQTTEYLTGDGFLAPGIYSIGNVDQADQNITEIIERQRNVGAFGEIKLGWRNALFVNATGRNDWSSTLPEDNRSFFFPSVGASAILSSLFPEIKSEKGINYLKIRSSWAKVGKDAPYGSLESSLSTNINGAASSAYTWNGVNVGNPELEPEFTTSIEFGVETRIFENRIGFEASYYLSKSDNQILEDIRVPPSTGTFYTTLNGGSLESKGFDFLLSAKILKDSDLKWETIFNFGTNKTTIDELPGELQEVYFSDSWTYRSTAAGAAILNGSLFGLRGKRPEKNDDGENLINDAGYYTFEDATYDDVNRFPSWTLGFTNTLNYKNISLSFLLDFVQDFEVYNSTESAFIDYGLSPKTLDRESTIILPGVNSTTGDVNTVAIDKDQVYYQDYYGYNSENFIEDGSFVKLRYITLGYKFPKTLLSRINIANAELFATGRNLLTITNYSGVDPEVNTFGAAITGAGSMSIDNLGTPSTKGIDLGLKIRF
jgi:TonB-linked SusC/RagA family outer membrane protein